jgi:hypothetical protein
METNPSGVFNSLELSDCFFGQFLCNDLVDLLYRAQNCLHLLALSICEAAIRNVRFNQYFVILFLVVGNECVVGMLNMIVSLLCMYYNNSLHPRLQPNYL